MATKSRLIDNERLAIPSLRRYGDEMTFSVRDTLIRFEEKVTARVEELRAELVPLERELADVKRALNALDREAEHRALPANGGAASRAAIDHFERQRARRNLIAKSILFGGGGLPIIMAGTGGSQSPYSNLTIKQLVRKALVEQFPDGAKATDLLEFFENAWGRTDIVRESLSPQLSRLKKEGLISLDGLIWRLVPNAPEFPELQGPQPRYENEPSDGKPEDGSETALAAQ